MKIGFLISTMASGGAERVTAVLCNAWVHSGHEVVLFTLQGPKHPVHYWLDSKIETQTLNLLHQSPSIAATIVNNFVRVSRIRRAIRETRPDVLICFMSEANVLGALAVQGLRVPVVISERVHPRFHRIKPFHRWSRRMAYPLADLLVVQTQDIADWCAQAFQLQTSPEVIPNPIDLQMFRPPQDCRSKGFKSSAMNTMVSVGRLESQKGMDHLIRVFHRIAEQHPDWSLDIYGEGSARLELQQQIDSAGLSRRVRLCGLSQNIVAVLRTADLFLFASRYEGFPNAIIEALACGLCVVASDVPGVAHELLANGKFGILAPVDDVEEWTSAVSALVNDPIQRQMLATLAPDAVRHLDSPRIAEQWISVLQNVVDSRR